MNLLKKEKIKDLTNQLQEIEEREHALLLLKNYKEEQIIALEESIKAINHKLIELNERYEATLKKREILEGIHE